MVAYGSPQQQCWHSRQLQLGVGSKLIVWFLPPEVMRGGGGGGEGEDCKWDIVHIISAHHTTHCAQVQYTASVGGIHVAHFVSVYVSPSLAHKLIKLQ